ncbi:ABC transporter ATP-binding protein [Roseomonas populi]|uniref:ABC transporter ATP-binding protein n=1 Tax=Roseomonas populi TaxID=3121582 RepID=A0ABT1WY11_9PROT|nr:ABC transporter ATP-binding protein [Roseomonas pecuniae]MCR0980728.1 ABC transporter ATP-binding protein [Roseomonas pecuniae]
MMAAPVAGQAAAARPPASAIAASGVRKVYSTASGPVEAVAEASFEIAQGEFVSILGPSGCGKSTLMLMVAGLEATTAGAITVDGMPVTGPQIEAGMMFQDPTLLPWRSVLDNVLFPVFMSRTVTPEDRARAEQLLRMVDLWPFRDKRPRELSGGMRQRVALARALIQDPGILLMDEPFSALDAITRDEMGLSLARIWDSSRKTAIFITHSIREAIFLSDRILVMGRRPSTIIEDVRVPFPRPRRPEVEADPAFNALYLHLKASIHRSPPLQ